MDIAAMNVRITFQKQEVVVDEIGNRTNEWTDFYSCFATISNSSGKTDTESEGAGATLDELDIGFTVRFCQKTFAVNSTGYRIIWNGEVYNIVKVDYFNMKKRGLKFRCRKVAR